MHFSVSHFSTERTIESNRPTYRVDEKNINVREKSEYVLRWQPLIETDRNVLQSVETSLKNPKNSATLFHSCEFFVNILLHDFPAEVFIQRPGIITVSLS